MTVPTGDGPDDYSLYKLLPRGKRFDYFTSCLPEPQRGESVYMPLGSTAPVVPNSENPMPTFTVHNDTDAVGNLHTYSASGSPYNQVHWNGRPGNTNGNLMWTDKGNTGLLVDLSQSASTTVQAFRNL